MKLSFSEDVTMHDSQTGACSFPLGEPFSAQACAQLTQARDRLGRNTNRT